MITAKCHVCHRRFIIDERFNRKQNGARLCTDCTAKFDSLRLSCFVLTYKLDWHKRAVRMSHRFKDVFDVRVALNSCVLPREVKLYYLGAKTRVPHPNRLVDGNESCGCATLEHCNCKKERRTA